jgi:hypothetical protein
MARAGAMAQAIGKGLARTQFSAPTHRGAWIDPRALVARSHAAETGAPALCLCDQVLALLRLAPDRRAEALAEAKSLASEWGAALRYALGGDEPIGETASLWIAAARARAPYGDDPRIASFFGTPTRGGDLAPRFSWRTATRGDGWVELFLHAGDQEGKGINFGKEGLFGSKLHLPTDAPLDEASVFPTLALCDPARLAVLDTYLTGDGAHGASSWAAVLWPQNPEPFFAVSVKSACLLDGANYMRPANEPLADAFRLALDPDVALGPMALMLLCRGLNAIDKATAAATVDALIAAIEDGRLDGDVFGAALHAFLNSGLVFPKRWPDRVREVAHSSPLALAVMRRALERALHAPTSAFELRDLHAWLEMLQELCVEAGAGIEDPLAREGIEARAPSGKAKKAAEALLDLRPAKGSDSGAAARCALRARIARAERWRANAETD